MKKLLERIEIPLSDDEDEDLELTLNPQFISGLSLVMDGLELSSIDWEEVKRSAKPIHFPSTYPV